MRLSYKFHYWISNSFDPTASLRNFWTTLVEKARLKDNEEIIYVVKFHLLSRNTVLTGRFDAKLLYSDASNNVKEYATKEDNIPVHATSIVVTDNL